MNGARAAGGLDVAIPAGGRVRPDRVEGMGTCYKPLALLGNEYLIHRVIRNVRQWPSVRRVALAAPVDVLEAIGPVADLTVEDQGSGPANLAACLDALGAPPWVLLMACDAPLITAAVCESFLERCPADADICFSYVLARHYRETFPGSPYLGLPLRGDRIVFGSLHLARTAVLQGHARLFERAFAARKRVWRMLGIAGIGLARRFVTGSLTLHDVEARVGDLLSCRCVGVQCHDPAIAFDIDKPEHLEYARRLIGPGSPQASDP